MSVNIWLLWRQLLALSSSFMILLQHYDPIATLWSYCIIIYDPIATLSCNCAKTAMRYWEVLVVDSYGSLHGTVPSYSMPAYACVLTSVSCSGLMGSPVGRSSHWERYPILGWLHSPSSNISMKAEGWKSPPMLPARTKCEFSSVTVHHMIQYWHHNVCLHVVLNELNIYTFFCQLLWTFKPNAADISFFNFSILYTSLSQPAQIVCCA